MAWGHRTAKRVEAPPPSAIRQLFPLVLSVLVACVVGWVCYQIYVGLSQIKEQAQQRMSKNNVTFTKDGMRVGVKDVDNEHYVDATQGWVVKAWNMADSVKRK